MLKLKTLSLVTLLLLLQACANKPRMYDLTGVWESECIDINDNNRYTIKIAYLANGSFESQSKTRYQSAFFSGNYKHHKTKLNQTFFTSSNPRHRNKLPKTQISDLKWIDNNSVLITTGNDKCTANRITNKS